MRVVIVTGASRGIGAGVVAAFGQAGYGVVATARSIHSSEERDILAVNGDIGEAETAHRVVEQALDRFGRIDTLVNNAGIYIGKPFIEYTPDDYEAITRVNLAGFFHITKLAIGQMVAQGGGHVVNVTANLVDDPGSEPPAALSALTKGGLAAVTGSLAVEFASRGVRVNAVAPSPIVRSGAIGDVADAILYLDAATSVSGETLHVDGGQRVG